WLGPDEDNYVKLVLVSDSAGGTRVEIATEDQGVLTSNGKTTVPAGSSLELRLLINAEEESVIGQYRLDPSDDWSNAGTSANTPTQVFGFDAAGNATYVGLFATHRNGPAPLTYDFDFFEL